MLLRILKLGSQLHSHKKSIINQREIGSDTATYKTAMKYLLRQDPDVCIVGELRDLTTIETALQTAEKIPADDTTLCVGAPARRFTIALKVQRA